MPLLPVLAHSQDWRGEVRPLAWHRVGGTAVEMDLAGPAGGEVTGVFFSADGSRLFAVTYRGSVWESQDLGESWTRSAAAPSLRQNEAIPGHPGPPGDPPARVYRHPYDSGILFALGRHLYRSVDGGQTWLNLSADALGSVLGAQPSAIAFSPRDPELVVVANSLGLWKSADGGLSWSGLNTSIPNLPEFQITTLRDGRPSIFLRGIGPARTLGSEAWQAAFDERAETWFRLVASLPPEDRLRVATWPLEMPSGWVASYRIWRGGQPASPDLTLCGSDACENPERRFISAFAGAVLLYYAGTSDGRLWVSNDGGQTWNASGQGLVTNGNPVTRIWLDPRNPRIGLVAVGGRGSGHVFRTTNGGGFWDDLSSNLPDSPARSITANGETGSVYVATEAGIFYTRADLRNPAPATPWMRLAGNLPETAMDDVRLDPVSGTLYAAARGYGLYRTSAPDLADALRVLNAADLSTRAAAPGGLLTVFGPLVRSASAGPFQAPVLASGRTESQIQVPFEAAGPVLDLSFDTQSGLRRVGIPLEVVSPAIFVDADGNALVLDAGSGSLIDPSRPARAGTQILILATGLGRVRPDWPTGLPAPLEDPPATIAPVSATLNGAPLRVISSTLAGGYIGVYVVRVELPAILNAGIGELMIFSGEKTSNRVTISIEP